MGYSLGDAPSEETRLSQDSFDVKTDCADGIYLECTVPKETWGIRVYIDGVGQVAEGICQEEGEDRGTFFYPFLDPGKECKIRVVFLRDEDRDGNGFVINYTDGYGIIGWFETKVTAGAGCKGKVRIEDFGEVKVEDNGDFRFIKRLTFQNEKLLPEDWKINIGLVEGVSWMHEGRKTKWSGSIDIPQKELTQTHNLYTAKASWKSENLKIDFICYRPFLEYEYDGKKYRYQWQSKCVDTPTLKTEAELGIGAETDSDVAGNDDAITYPEAEE